MKITGIRSPLAKVNILLSSSTVFKFSIQMASTGPSQTIQILFLLSLLLDLAHIVENIPGIQSSP